MQLRAGSHLNPLSRARHIGQREVQSLEVIAIVKNTTQESIAFHLTPNIFC
jgi:hypothetical protein